MDLNRSLHELRLSEGLAALPKPSGGDRSLVDLLMTSRMSQHRRGSEQELGKDLENHYKS